MSEDNKKTRKTKSATKTDKAFLGRLREAWKLSVGEFAVEEGETRTLLGRLEALGTVTRDEAKQVLAYAKKNIDKNRLELEKRVEESVKSGPHGSSFQRTKKYVRSVKESLRPKKGLFH